MTKRICTGFFMQSGSHKGLNHIWASAHGDSPIRTVYLRWRHPAHAQKSQKQAIDASAVLCAARGWLRR
jgi:hypothetical protein